MPQIGRFRILDELGRGATGVVYRAQDPAINRIIAIKTIRLADLTDESERDRLRERLFREAQSAGILSHPNIVTIYDIAEEEGLAYIFMEFVDGPSLEKTMNSPQPLDRNLALGILRQTATGLDYAHKKGIVHRDIKPANILLHEGSMAKITDFGVAKILSQQMTHTGVMMGTPNYMSPEQVQGHAVDGRADQFSLAVIAYEILTGEKPFLADQLPALLFRIVREDPVPPQRLNQSLAPQVEVALRKALAKPAADRYANCTEFVEALAVACNLNPQWHTLARSGAQSMPTIGGGAPAANVAERPGAIVPDGPLKPPPPQREPIDTTPSFAMETYEGEARNPILRSLVWMLVGIGLVGLVLFGAQKYLFNRGPEPGEQVAQAPAAGAPPAQSNAKPSPIGSATDQPIATPAPNASAAPQSTTPQATAPQSTAPETASATPPPQSAATPAQPPAQQPPPQERAAPEEPPQRKQLPAKEREPRKAERASVAAASESQPEFRPSVQFVTEPPDAQIIIDGGATPGCKTPCLLPVSPGRHSLNVRVDGYRPYPRVFSVPQDREIFLTLTKLSGTLSVTSNPPGATIEINGEMQNKRTPAIFNFAPGSYRVRVARNGAALDFDVQLRDGAFVNKKVDF